MSLPIQEDLTECQKCGCDKFRFVAHYDSWHPRRALWEYACTSCGQHHTTINSHMKIAKDVPYNTVKGPTKRKPPRWKT